MKMIGMIGGMSWASSAEYYRLANTFVAERFGGHHSARLVLYSVDFAEVERMQVDGDWEAAADLLAGAARDLAAGGAELLVLCTNTMHKVASTIEAATDLPFLHIADSTAAAIHAAGANRVALLGTRFTMEQPFLRDELEQRGVSILIPAAEDRATIDRIIYDELVHDAIRPESRGAYLAVIERLAAAGADGVILGCTEIELLLDDVSAAVPMFPTTQLHVQAALDVACARND
jgi:aspartate racemase